MGFADAHDIANLVITPLQIVKALAMKIIFGPSPSGIL